MGLLQHATKVIKPGRTFVARMYREAGRLKNLSHFTRLTKDFHSDLRWWHLFMSTWNGVSFMNCSPQTPRADYQITTDASGSRGCGAVFETQWFQLAWSTEWTRMDIMAKELVPIVLSCAVWGPLILQKKIGIQVRQSQPCRCHQQRFIKGTYGHASLAVPLVFLSFL